MALQSATDAKTASDAAVIQTNATIISLTMTVINTQITAESTRIDKNERTYKASFTFDAKINDGSVEIIQADESSILLSDLIGALTLAGYRTSDRVVPASRLGLNDTLKLTVAWD